MAETGEPLSPLKQALVQLREMRARLETIEAARSEPVAIVGVGLRLPGGADTPEAFWQLLRDGVDTISEVPGDRWDVDALFDPDPASAGKMTTRFGAFLKDVDRFDAAYFGISPREAASLDPQQRLLLEVTWEALGRAGQAPDRLAGSQTGVYVGFANSDYFRQIYADLAQIDAYTGTGNAGSVAAGRIAYLLGLHGPCLTLDTACSSSLVAVHLAVQGLRRRECDLALAGGVNLILSPEVNINFSKAQGMMAPDGRCKTFDARADGYVRGEGCAMVVLKRLSDAQAQGDPILAVIRGTAINHDGRSSGLTAPNGPAQESVIRAALDDAGLRPDEIDYVEAHGTGTSLGDPIEVGAIAAALGAGRDADHPLWIGSLKTNMGHLESAAGIAGLIKTALALQHGQIPPHLHFETPSPHIAWNQYPIAVPTAQTLWPVHDGPRFAGVSSFGFSGTNAHVILGSAPEPESVAAEGARPLQLMTLSARTEPALRASAAALAKHLEEHPHLSLADVALTLNTGRPALAHRLVVPAASLVQARDGLAAFAADPSSAAIRGVAQPGARPEVAFLFTGQGSHYPGMGRGLYEAEPVFREVIDQCDEFLRRPLGQSLRAVLFGEAGTEQLLDEMRYAQPAIFALDVALARLWRSWGVEPAFVAGHSLGEYAAACVAGVFSLADGLKLVAARGRLMTDLHERGAMVTVFADEARVAAALAPFAADAAIAAVNGPETVVISGRGAAVDEVVARLKADRVRSRPLPIAQASHSPLIEPILDEFAAVAAEVAYRPPEIALISGVTGQEADAALVGQPGYWRRHFRETVRFAAVMRTLDRSGVRAYVDVGPNPMLLSLGQRCVADEAQSLWLPSLRQGRGDHDQILESLGALFVNGVEVDWDAIERAGGPAHRVVLPTYPWERKSFWWSSAPGVTAHVAASPAQRWVDAVEAARLQAGQAPLDLNLGDYPEVWRTLDALTAAYARNTLAALGLFQTDGEVRTADEVVAAGRIKTTYRHLMERWLTALTVDGSLQALPADRFRADQALTTIDLAPLWSQAEAALAKLPFLIDYVRRCGDLLPAVLTGAESALETLFPGGSDETAEAIYRHWALARYFNGIVRAAVDGAGRRLPANSPLRIIEVGAGTGATTASVLPALDPARAQYRFTDVSDVFLSRAAEKFGAYPFVRYGLLDVERSAEAQGLAPHAFDVVIAANVLHATPDLRATLGHVRELLSADGVLVLYEATRAQPWFDMTTGLIEGWQKFDDGLRDDSPLLPPSTWRDILGAAGFDAVEVFPEAGSPAEILGQHVILARGPAGVISQPFTGASDALAPTATQPAQPQAAADTFRRLWDEAPPAERQDLLAEHVRQTVARVLRLDPSAVDRRGRLMDLGVDSLMALELRNLLTRSLGLEKPLPATLIFDHPTIEAVAEHLAAHVLDGSTQAAAAVTTPELATPSTLSPAELEALSDEDVEAMLLEKLKSLDQ